MSLLCTARPRSVWKDRFINGICNLGYFSFYSFGNGVLIIKTSIRRYRLHFVSKSHMEKELFIGKKQFLSFIFALLSKGKYVKLKD